MMNQTASRVIPVLFICAFFLSSACAHQTDHRSLLISEVGKHEVELYLNEDAGRQLLLDGDLKLQVTTNDNGTTLYNELRLGAYGGTIDGQSFLMIWEDSNYTGAPVAADYPSGITGTVPGIKVADDFFDKMGDEPTEVRLVGSNNRTTGVLAIFPIVTEDIIGDTVRFGLPQSERPDSGGNFSENGILIVPASRVHVQRGWSSGNPIESDREEDWANHGQGWGVCTGYDDTNSPPCP